MIQSYQSDNFIQVTIHFLDERGQFSKSGLSHVRDGQACAELFQHSPDFVDVSEVICTQLGHHSAPMRKDAHQPFGL